MKLRTTLLATTFAAAIALGAPAAAQDVASDPAMTSEPVEDEDDDSGKWGLLGLLGLAGLMGLKRKDDDHRHTTNTTGTGGGTNR